MKNLLLLFISILSFQISSFAQEGWNNVTPSGTYAGFKGVYALHTDNVWVVGDEGTILHTTDAGITWASITSGITARLNCVQFINPDTGWISSNSTTDSSIFRTTDGGLSWELQPVWNVVPNEYEIDDIEFIEGLPGEPMRGYATGGLTYTWRTDDYGETWERVSGDCGLGSFWSCSFVDKNTGWFVGVPSTIIDPITIVRTTDGGDTFEAQTNPVAQPFLRSVCFVTDQRGIAVGLGRAIVYTSDGGTNWEARSIDVSRAESVFLTETGKSWVVGEQGKIFYSTDWGYTWVPQESGVSADVSLWEVYFLNDNEGWIAGGGLGQPGVILHTTNGGVITDVDEENNNIVANYGLEQNYPNPFNPATNIKWQIPEAGFVSLKIFDVLGNEIKVLVDEERDAGIYENTFNAEDLGSGIYFYQIKAGDPSTGSGQSFIETKKMILIK